MGIRGKASPIGGVKEPILKASNQMGLPQTTISRIDVCDYCLQGSAMSYIIYRTCRNRKSTEHTCGTAKSAGCDTAEHLRNEHGVALYLTAHTLARAIEQPLKCV